MDSLGVTVIDDAFPEPDRKALWEALKWSGVRWENSAALGHTAFGAACQLVNDEAYRGDAIQRWRMKHEALVRSTAHRSGIPVSQFDGPVQVFPVRMEVREGDAPSGQRLHTDSAGGVTPVLTSVYYAEVDDVQGGDLIAHLGDGETRRISPKVNRLVIMAGATPHEVAPMTAGRRVSYVCNYYVAPEEEGR